MFEYNRIQRDKLVNDTKNLKDYIEKLFRDLDYYQSELELNNTILIDMDKKIEMDLENSKTKHWVKPPFVEESEKAKILRYQHNNKLSRHNKLLNDKDYQKIYKEESIKRYSRKKQRMVDDPEYREKIHNDVLNSNDLHNQRIKDDPIYKEKIIHELENELENDVEM